MRHFALDGVRRNHRTASFRAIADLGALSISSHRQVEKLTTPVAIRRNRLLCGLTRSNALLRCRTAYGLARLPTRRVDRANYPLG